MLPLCTIGLIYHIIIITSLTASPTVATVSSIDRNLVAPTIIEDAVLKCVNGKGHNYIFDLYIITIILDNRQHVARQELGNLDLVQDGVFGPIGDKTHTIL
ncbi:hypothetical protein FVEN_g12775 [Fusarium venenatum]|nr:hypothetical protein FVEN_g12775 [Fusarium venenatum]